jgi:hypothetical protein
VVLWVVALCNLLGIYQRVGGTYCSVFRVEVRSERKGIVYTSLEGVSCHGDLATLHFSPEDGGSMFLRNIGIQPKDYTAQQTRSPPSTRMLPTSP